MTTDFSKARLKKWRSVPAALRKISRRCWRSSRVFIHRAWVRAICVSVCSFNYSVEEAQKPANNIARLNPRPGQFFAAAPQTYVLPDGTVQKVDGDYQLILN